MANPKIGDYPRYKMVRQAMASDEIYCFYCRQAREYHVNRKCMFAPTTFAEMHARGWMGNGAGWDLIMPASPLVWYGG